MYRGDCELMYELIIRQFLVDGYKDLALHVSKALNFNVHNFSPSNELFCLLSDVRHKNEFFSLPTKKLKIDSFKKKSCESAFNSRTEESSALQYFDFYGYLYQQQNMLQDFFRTSTYQRAILENFADFKNKIVIDVGAGSGILSFFATQAGAKLVYAVEASAMAVHCQTLIKSNNCCTRIKLISGKIEEVDIPDLVDIIISEPMGYMLVNERMLESFVNARRFLKSGGKMFPSEAFLHFALFSDEALYLEQAQRCSFWCQENFHGVDLSALKNKALEEIFCQPVVDTWSSDILITDSEKWSFDFEKDNVEKLHNIEVPFSFKVLRTCHIHGIASWFDVAFSGTLHKIWLSTSPTKPLTHWYQVRCLLQSPVLVFADQIVKGRITMIANERQSYNIQLVINLDGQDYVNTFDLKSPHFRYNTSQSNQYCSKSIISNQKTNCKRDTINKQDVDVNYQ